LLLERGSYVLELLNTFASALRGPALTWEHVVRLLLAAFVFGQVVVWVYERTYRGLSFSRDFAQTLLLIAITACVFVMAIGRSIYAGLGMLAVLSIIRFRANVKSPRDLVFVMAAATVGVAAGVDSLVVAGIGALAFAAVTIYLHFGPFGARSRFDGILRFTVASGEDATGSLRPLLDRHCSRSALLSMGEIAQGKLVEHTYQVKFARGADRERLLTDLKAQLAVQDARLLLQEPMMEY
jgi:hypothetical protein